MITLDLTLQYVFYGGLIVLGLLILWLIKHKNRLPGHADVRKKLDLLHQNIQGFIDEKNNSGYFSFKEVTKLLYRVNKLLYQVSELAEKERDGDLGSVAISLERVSSALSPYKFRKKDNDEISGLINAEIILENAVALMDRIIERDKALKARKLRG